MGGGAPFGRLGRNSYLEQRRRRIFPPPRLWVRHFRKGRGEEEKASWAYTGIDFRKLFQVPKHNLQFKSDSTCKSNYQSLMGLPLSFCLDVDSEGWIVFDGFSKAGFSHCSGLEQGRAWSHQPQQAVTHNKVSLAGMFTTNRCTGPGRG